MFNKTVRKIILLSIFILGFQFIGIFADDLRESIIPDTTTITEIGHEVGADKEAQIGVLSQLLTYVKDSIFGVLGTIAIGMFIFVGFNLVKAQGNPEEMTKAWKTLIHLIVGLFVVAVSWALVVMVSGLKI